MEKYADDVFAIIKLDSMDNCYTHIISVHVYLKLTRNMKKEAKSAFLDTDLQRHASDHDNH